MADATQILNARAQTMSKLRGEFRNQSDRDSDTTQMLSKLLGLLEDMQPAGNRRGGTATSKLAMQNQQAAGGNRKNPLNDTLDELNDIFRDFSKTSERREDEEKRETAEWNIKQKKELHNEFEELRKALKDLGDGGGFHLPGLPHLRLPRGRGRGRGRVSHEERRRLREEARERERLEREKAAKERARAKEEERARKAADKEAREKAAEEKRAKAKADTEEKGRRAQSDKEAKARDTQAAKDSKAAREAEQAKQAEAAKAAKAAKDAEEAAQLQKAETARKAEAAAAEEARQAEVVKKAEAARQAETARQAQVAAEREAAQKAADAEKVAKQAADAEKTAKTAADLKKAQEAEKVAAETAKTAKGGGSLLRTGAKTVGRGLGEVAGLAMAPLDAYFAYQDISEAHEHANESLFGQGEHEEGIMGSRFSRYADATMAGAGLGAAGGALVGGIGAIPGAIGGAIAGAGSVALAESGAGAYIGNKASQVNSWLFGGDHKIASGRAGGGRGGSRPVAHAAAAAAAAVPFVPMPAGGPRATAATPAPALGPRATGASLPLAATLAAAPAAAGMVQDAVYHPGTEAPVNANNATVVNPAIPSTAGSVAVPGKDKSTDNAPIGNFSTLHMDFGDLESMLLNIDSVQGYNTAGEGSINGVGNSGGAAPSVNFNSGFAPGQGPNNSATQGIGSSSAAVRKFAADLDPKTEKMVRESAIRQGVDPDKAVTIARIEGGGNNTSTAGARGPMQLMPGTFASMGGTDINDIQQNIDAGVKYLGVQLQSSGGDLDVAGAKYNAGPHHSGIQEFQSTGNTANLPQETQNYVQKTRALMQEYREARATAQDTKDNTKAVAAALGSKPDGATGGDGPQAGAAPADKVQRTDFVEKQEEQRHVDQQQQQPVTSNANPPSTQPAGTGAIPDINNVPMAVNDQGLMLVLSGSVG